MNKKLNSKSFIHSVSGGTDIVSCFMLGVPTLPVYAGEIQGPGLGMNIDIFNEKGKPTKSTGELVCKTPFLLNQYIFGMIKTLVNINLHILINLKIFGLMVIT
jgi:acyl-coenzyme A synthetase/AMP-(fatty) acid ligase